MLLLVSYFLFLIVKRYRAFVYTAIQKKLLLLYYLLVGYVLTASATRVGVEPWERG